MAVSGKCARSAFLTTKGFGVPTGFRNLGGVGPPSLATVATWSRGNQKTIGYKEVLQYHY